MGFIKRKVGIIILWPNGLENFIPQ